MSMRLKWREGVREIDANRILMRKQTSWETSASKAKEEI
jgi:hypothetical protein